MSRQRHSRRSFGVDDPNFLIPSADISLPSTQIQSTAGLATSWQNVGLLGDTADVDTIVGTAANLRVHPSGSILFGGSAGDYVSMPDSPAASVTGDIELILDLELVDRTPSSTHTVCAKAKNTSNRAWFAEVYGDGDIGFTSYSGASATGQVQVRSTVPSVLIDGARKKLKITRLMDNGAGGNDTKFYLSDDGITWTQLGDTLTVYGTTSIFDNDSPVEIGSGFLGTSQVSKCNIYSAEIYDGIDGTLVSRCDPKDAGQANGLDGDTFTTVFGGELVTNGDFATDSDWTKGAGWTIAGGKAIASSASGNLQIPLLVTAGNTYTVTVELSERTSGSLGRAQIGSVAGPTWAATGVGTYTTTIIPVLSGTEILYIVPTALTGSIDNVSVKQSNTFTLHGNTFANNTGHTGVKFLGSAGLETSAGGVTINQPMHIFMVAEADALTGANQFFLDGESDAAATVSLYAVATTDEFRADAGAALDLAAGDTGIHVWSLAHNGDTSSNGQVSGTAVATGTIGTENLDALSIGLNSAGALSLQGSMYALYIFKQRVLPPPTIERLERFLTP